MNKYRVYSKDGDVRCRLTKVEYSGTFMGDRVVTSSFTSATEIAFEVFDYIEFRGEKFELEMIPTVKKVSSYQYEYDLRFVSLKYELERCMFRDFVPNDNEVVYPTPVTVEFTGKVNYLTERIQACLDRMYGAGVWSIVVSEGVDSEEKNLSLSNQNCWNALSLVNTEYKLNFHINGRTVVVGDSEAVQGVVFEYGKGNGLYEIERAADSDTGIVTKLIAYGGTRNLDYSYPKKPEWSDSVLPNTFILSPLRLMLPSFKKDGKTDYLLADDALIAKYGIREGVMMYDDIYPTITGATNSKGERIDKIAGVDAITDEETSEFDVYLNDLGFDLNDSLTTETPQLVMKTGALQGYSFNIKTIGALSNGGVRVTLEKNSIDNSDTGGYYIPNKDFNMSAGDEFVLLGILMPQLYILNAEQRLEERAREYLNQYSTTNYSYSIGVDEIFMAKNPSVMAEVFEGKKMKINDDEIGINEELVTIQSLTIEDGDGLIPRIKVTLNNNPSASTLERIQGQIANIESTANSQYSAQTELAKQYQRKLNTSYFNRLFVAIDANGNEIAPNDTTTPIASVRVNYGLWTEQFLSAKGMNSGGGSDEPTTGATTLGGLRNVAADADKTYEVAKMLVLEAKSNLWSLKNLSELVGLDENALAAYLTTNNYAKKSDIPSLDGYATEQWVLGKGYLTEHQDLSAYAKKTDIPTIPTKVSAFENDANYATTSDLDSRIDALVNGAPQAYDTLKEIADVLAGNVNSISDILTALGNKADKATTLSGYGITDAYTITQIDSIVNGLSKNISTLQGYFTDGVANSALKLSDNGSYTAWGQTFFTNGKPKSVSGALTDVTDITSSGTITTNKIVIGNGTIEWDEANKGFKVTGLYSTTYLSAKGANTNGGSSSGGGLIESLFRYADLGKTFADTNNDTFNAYTINKINSDLGSRISVLEGKATNVSYAATQTSGTKLGTITIDGVAKNIYAPTIPTSDINKGVTAYGWGNHASVGYLTRHQDLSGYQPLITSSNKLAYSLISDVPTTLKNPYSLTFGSKTYDGSAARTILASDLGALTEHQTIYALTIKNSAGTTQLTYTPNSAVGELTLTKAMVGLGNVENTKLSTWVGTNKITTLGTITTGVWNGTKIANGYLANNSLTIAGNTISLGGTLDTATLQSSLGFSGLLTSVTSSNDTNLSITVGGTTKSVTNIYAKYTNFFVSKWGYDLAETFDLNEWTSGGIVRCYGNSTNLLNKPVGFTFGNVLALSNGYEALTGQLAWAVNHNSTTDTTKAMWFRVNDSANGYTYAKWHQIAFTDSNVASATKLKTARSIWGQSFNGESDVDGVLYMTNSGATATKAGVLGFDSNTLYVGYSNVLFDVALNGYNNVFLKTRSTIGLTLNSSGNVLIGTTTDSGYKLDVNGSGYFNSYIAIANNNGIYFKDTSGTIRSQLYVDPNNNTSIGYGAIQTSGNTALYGTYIRFLTSSSDERMRITNNGYVGIGTTSPSYMLDVNGTLNASGAVTFGSTLGVTGQTTLSGTVDMGGAVRIVNSKYIYGRTNENVLHNILGINDSNVLLVNYGASARNVKAWLYGNEFRFNLYTDGATNGTLAWTDSKLGVGTSTPEYNADIRGTIGVSDAITLRGTAAATANIAFSRSSYNYITFPTDGSLCLSTATSTSGIVLRVTSTAIEPMTTATKSVGTSSKRWGAIYGVDGDFSGTIHSTTGIWSDGYVSAKGQNTSSDMRLKNILNDVVLNVSDIANAPSVRFAWKNGGGVDVGSSAQYWQGLLPDAVKERDGMLEMQYANIALLSAIAIAKRVEILEQENKELRSEIMILKGGNYA